MNGGRDDGQRLDKYLWFARVLKTRTAAARLVSEGYVRVNGQRVSQPAKIVQKDDVLTIALERQVRVLRILALGLRRGPYQEAKLLYEEIGGGPPSAACGEGLGRGDEEPASASLRAESKDAS